MIGFIKIFAAIKYLRFNKVSYFMCVSHFLNVKTVTIPRSVKNNT